MKKKILRFRTTAVAVMMGLLLSIAGLTKMYAQVTIGDLQYYLSTGYSGAYATVAGHKDGSLATGTLTIPETVTYEGVTYTVYKVGNSAFSGCNHLTGNLFIPNSVTIIGDCAFMNCTGITGRLTIGDSVTYMGGEVFKNCFFDEIYYNAINCSDFWYPSYPFESCGGGTLIIGNSVERIPSFVFYNAYFTNNPNIPNSVKSIGQGAFDRTMWYFNQPNGFLYLDGWCLGYKGDKPIGDLVIQDGTIGIGDNSFWLCNGLTSVDMPNSVQYIGKETFYECTELVSVSLGTTLKKIGSEAFGECSNLPSIVIPNTVTEIEGGAFIGCSNLTTLNIPNTLTSISGTLFCRCYNLASISIPNSVTSIEDGAFLWCSSLSEISLPNSISTIGMDAFSCSGLTSIVIPSSVVSIGGRAFADSPNLTYAYIGSSVSSIEGGLFNGCTNLIHIEVASDNIKYDSRDNCNAIIYTANNMLIAGCKTTIIPNTVTTIGTSAFSECGGLTYIEIPNSVTVIGSDAFARCRALNSIKFPNTLTTISETAFVECSALTSINIPSTVTEIGGSAFAWCSGLESVIVGNSLVYIGNQLFEECRSLRSVSFLSYNPPLMYDYYEVFPSSNLDFAIYVPYESLDEYKTATNWSIYADYIQPLSYKSIQGYNTGNGNWQFIASPLAENTTPTTIEDMLPTAGTFDLYRFDQTENAEWQNYKANSFTLTNGQSYLYANQEDVNLIFKGTFNEGTSQEVSLTYDGTAQFAGWNLVGNPFPYAATVSRSYYVMNEDGTAIEPTPLSTGNTIAACTGIMVKADEANESVTFAKPTRQNVVDNGLLHIAVANEDKAIVSFNKGDELAKYVFNMDKAQLYIPQSGMDYAIAVSDKQGVMPLNFKAAKDGEYNISIKPQNLELDYLHLIDNLTGNDVDLVPLLRGQGGLNHSAVYTFTAKTTDYASRFHLVFSVCGNADGNNDAPFAFVSNGEIVLTGIGADTCNVSLQVIDMQGRILICRDARLTSAISINGMASGVYVLRLINGDDVKTQKIVID